MCQPQCLCLGAMERVSYSPPSGSRGADVQVVASMPFLCSVKQSRGGDLAVVAMPDGMRARRLCPLINVLTDGMHGRRLLTTS
jgi:hypothetical protein